jgi:hypothetical protein
MALLLDGPPSTIADLSARDSDLLNVAVTESIDLTSKLQLAAADIGMAVESMLMSALPPYGALRTGFPALKNIAVTHPLKLWHTYVTLRLVYQDLYYSRLNDRYQAKMKLYQEEEARAVDDLRTIGLGIVFDPLPQAQAPGVASIPTSDTGGSMYVAAAFLNQRGEEGLPSVPIEVDTQDGSTASINMTWLVDNATGWNLYAGLSPDALTRQNPQMLDRGTAATLSPGQVSAGPKPGSGQHANLYHPIPRRILRG